MIGTILSVVIFVCVILLLYVGVGAFKDFRLKELAMRDFPDMIVARMFMKCSVCGHEFEHADFPVLTEHETHIEHVFTIEKGADRTSVVSCPNCKLSIDMIIQRDFHKKSCQD
jgi:transcription elongation factor Elf1